MKKIIGLLLLIVVIFASRLESDSISHESIWPPYGGCGYCRGLCVGGRCFPLGGTGPFNPFPRRF